VILERIPELTPVAPLPAPSLPPSFSFTFALGGVLALDLATPLNGPGFARLVFPGAIGGLGGVDWYIKEQHNY
jgi:hypothetical protein